MLEQSKDRSNNLNPDEFNDENNLNPDNNFGLVKLEQIKNFTNILKKLVKYDRDLFDIFSKVKRYNNPDDMQQISGNFTSLLDDENDGDLGSNKSNQSNAPKEIVKKNTSTVEEKIDYIMGNYKKDPRSAEYQMSSYTGYSFDLIFALVSEIAKGENNFECELVTASVFESMETKGQLTPEQAEKLDVIFSNFAVSASNLFAFESKQNIPFVFDQLNKKEVLSQLREKVQNYKTAKEKLEKMFDNTLVQIKGVLGIPNENNKDNLNLNLNIKKRQR